MKNTNVRGTGRRGVHRLGPRVLVSLVLATALLGGTGSPTPVVAAPAVAAPVAVPGDVEWFTGTVDEFYVVPDPLPPGDVGELIRVQAVNETASSVTVRIMYHSRDRLDRDRAVTGTLTYPKAAPPAGGWPVVSTANGTVGMASQCAPSRRSGGVATWGLPVVAVASDYIGLGPAGELHPYLSRVSEGNSVIDAVRAARDLPAANAGTRWLAVGGSQGGHGALSAHELGAARAPELELLGTVAMAPAAMFGHTYGGFDPLIERVLTAMGFFGGLSELPEVDVADYATPAAIAASRAMSTGCLNEITLAVLGVPFDQFWIDDPFETEPARSLLLANDVGHLAVDAPVLLVQGTADTTVLPARTRDLRERMCGTGQTLSYLEIEGADHGNVGARALTEIRAWMAARLADDPAPDTCSPPVVVPDGGVVVEGDGGSASVRVSVNLSRAVTHPVTVHFRTLYVPGLAGQADPGTDYEPVDRAAVTFAPGQTEAHAEVAVHGDLAAEDDELIVLSFGQVEGGRIGGFWGLGFGGILDDD